jgi:hypothetical protein
MINSGTTTTMKKPPIKMIHWVVSMILLLYDRSVGQDGMPAEKSL